MSLITPNPVKDAEKRLKQAQAELLQVHDAHETALSNAKYYESKIDMLQTRIARLTNQRMAAKVTPQTENPRNAALA